MRQWLIERSTLVYPVIGVTNRQVELAVNRGLLHRLLIALDVLMGAIGAQVPYITISSRTALHMMQPSSAPTWALALGYVLEAIDPGHLQNALLADICRCVSSLQYTAGKRVLV